LASEFPAHHLWRNWLHQSSLSLIACSADDQAKMNAAMEPAVPCNPLPMHASVYPSLDAPNALTRKTNAQQEPCVTRSCDLIFIHSLQKGVIELAQKV
jgi:hypothetical protein